jgi:hypothetical protein
VWWFFFKATKAIDDKAKINTKNYLFLKIRIFFYIKNRFKTSKKIFLK